jgi:adenylate cyclase
MSEIFISYARTTSKQASDLAKALRARGYAVWRDEDLPAHRPYSEVIEERIGAAGAVLVVWSAEATRSQWVQSEAEKARMHDKLVQVTVDGAQPPMPFDRIHCADLTGWTGDPQAPAWRKILASLAEMTGGPPRSPSKSAVEPPGEGRLCLCVLPFANMSGEPEQEYFSDGISEDIITDLFKVRALSVISRNSAFQYKGRNVDLLKVARELNVTHVLEGSVRKVGGRLRISAQLIDGAAGDHVWAERYDRDLGDIFALQDEISQAIVAALKLKLLPEEKKAIGRRGTDNVEAYNLYLMARQYYVSGNTGDIRGAEAILRLCKAAIDLDPGYARAWALMAGAQRNLHFNHGAWDDGLSAAERAIALDPTLAEPHAVRANDLAQHGRLEAADAEIELALKLDPECFEANFSAGLLCFRNHRMEDSIRYFEKAAALMEADFQASGMLITCYTAIGDRQKTRRAAAMTLVRAEQALTQDQNNGSAMGMGVSALAALGEGQRAREWTQRALLIDPDNMIMRYNFACSFSTHLKDADGALALLAPVFAATATLSDLEHSRVDPDLDPIRDDPRFQAMVAAARARLAGVDEERSPAA